MGNSSPKYYNERDALDLLGVDTWKRLNAQLESLNGAVDFNSFCKMVLQKFRNMPKFLCECIYRGFAGDIQSVVEINDFICTLGLVRGLNTTLLMSFVFRVYDFKALGEISRQQLLKQLQLAYGTNINQYNVEFDINKLFEDAASENHITAREFETYRGPSRVFTEWVSAVLSSLLDSPPARLEALEIKYSTTREADQMMLQYNIPKSLCNKLYRMFVNICRSPGRPEMELRTWLKLASKYVHPALAFEIFRAKLHDVKVAWRFVDFFEFCYLFGLFLPNMTDLDATEVHTSTTFSTVERQAAALCTIFQLAAERETDPESPPSQHSSTENLESLATIAGGRPMSASSLKLVLYMRRLVYLLSISSPSSYNYASDDKISKIIRRVSIPAAKDSYLHAAATASAGSAGQSSIPQFDVLRLSPLDTMTTAELENLRTLSASSDTAGAGVIAPVVVRALLELETSCKVEPTLKEYVAFLCGFQNFLPGFKQLSMFACCSFGVKPLVPELEKLYIIDLILSRQEEAPQSKEFPNGPIGTEWCVLSSAWLNSWRFFVGQKRRNGSNLLSDVAIKDQLAKDERSKEARQQSRKKNGTGLGAPPVVKNVINAMMPFTMVSSLLKPFVAEQGRQNSDDLPPGSSHSNKSNGDHADSPPPIDNFVIVSKRPVIQIIPPSVPTSAVTSEHDQQQQWATSSAPVLHPGLDISQHLELVPPDVYKTLFLWYGGGPQITRWVIRNSSGQAELELYPLIVRICRCDPNGNQSADEKEFFFSKMTTVGDMIKALCSYYRCAEGTAKIWDYSTTSWKTQKLISDVSKTLAEVGIVEGQLLLLEVSLGDGTWPRTQRQSQLENEDGGKGLTSSNSLTSLVSASNVTAGGGLLAMSRFPNAYSIQSPLPRVPLNKGRVGIDNLGNTCYMCSSLQVLLHTDYLVEYFMRKAYLKHVNIHSRHGYKGRLAHAFGKLVTNLWCTDKSSVSPRNFRHELAQIQDQFAGNEQHDAQELMIFLLDGLSEDVNLVQDKPYIENPDSDGRSDEELANIWWLNHRKRENSVIQALFTGQFKSVMHCSNCNHRSARFEPFNSLALPLPEDHSQTVFVDVITLGCSFRIQRCVVVVLRTDTLQTVVDKIVDPDFGILGLMSPGPYFLAVDTFDSKVREFHPLTRLVSNILSHETIALYEVMTPFDLRGPSAKNEMLQDAKDVSQVDAENKGSKVVPGDEEHESTDAPMVLKSGMKGGSDADAASDSSSEENIDSEAVPDSNKISIEPVVNPWTRVVVIQRRAKYVVGGGISNFSCEPFNTPIVDVFPSRISSSELYSQVYGRLKYCLKAPLDLLLSGAGSTGSHRHGVKGGLGTSNDIFFGKTPQSPVRSAKAVVTSQPGNGSQATIKDLSTYYHDTSDGNSVSMSRSSSAESIQPLPTIRPVEIEEAVARDISAYGFVLRYVRPDGVSCSRCPWLHGCQGCIVPDSPDLMIDLEDGTVFAADWHYIVYHELIESSGVLRGDINHPSLDATKRKKNGSEISLNSCFDKFVEEEKLEGIVCPKCHEDSHLSKNFILWRLPPILFVQLKRFQFDRYSRRKLNDLVRFPIDNLDLSAYLAPGSPHLSPDTGETSHTRESGDKADGVVKDCSCNLQQENHLCSTYHLYAVVHHVGIMGGGHYVASVRDNSAAFEALHNRFSKTEEATEVQSTSTSEDTRERVGGMSDESACEGSPLSRQWWCYNDSTVTPIKEEDIISPSAYLLFYMRDDIARGKHRLEDIFNFAESLDESINMERDEHVDIEDDSISEDQHSRGAKYTASEDVSCRRGTRTSEQAGQETDDPNTIDEIVHNPVPEVNNDDEGSNRKRVHQGGSAARNRNGTGEKASEKMDVVNSNGPIPTSKGGPPKNKKQVGYTEEEFEKIMQGGDTQQCSVS